MKAQFHYYITKHIRSYYRRRMLAPAFYLILLAILAFIVPVFSMLSPKKVSYTYNLENGYNNGVRYVQITMTNLYFTGYTKNWLDSTSGYYYYTTINDECVIVLLEPKTCQQGVPTIENLTVRAKILEESEAVDTLITNLAADLAWSTDGISATISSYTLSQPDAVGLTTRVFLYVYVITGLLAILSLLHCLLCLLFPGISGPCLRLMHYGKPWEVLRQAEEELSTLPQLATEDMFITEHFFIETSSYGVAIVPISEMVWIYKYSHRHKFLWHTFNISYTMHITAYGNRYVHCPKNTKSDIDGIMDYLAEANHSILVGFNEKNRLRAARLQAKRSVLRRWWYKFIKLLNKRV